MNARARVAHLPSSSPAGDPYLVGDFPIVIIGAGFGGVGAGIMLKQAGFENFVIVERASDLGGTWRDNTYPGCACDVPSYVYSYSFEPNPDWSRAYSPSHEIHQYIRHCARKYGINPHLRLNTTIVDARFDDARGMWHVTTDDGRVLQARMVVSCVGGLVNPAWPEIPGLDKFKGPVMHTARWDHSVDLKGKRVGVVGTGASAIQVIPAIAPDVKHLTVFQRTPPWVLPKPDREIESWRKQVYRMFPALQKLHRNALYLLSESYGPMVIFDTPLSRIPETMGKTYIRRVIKDPDLRRKVTPDYRLGCKRVLVSNDYYPALTRDNVHLETSDITRVTATGITTADGQRHRLDVLVLATGFKLDIGNAPFPVVGRGGRTLDEAWAGGATAYKGMTVAGFPNWFTVLGPNTGPGHTSVLVYSEAQFQHIIEAARQIKKRGLRFVDVKQSVQDRYNRQIQKRMANATWTSGCNSWYLDEHGVNRTLFPGFASEYVLRARHFNPRDYSLVR